MHVNVPNTTVIIDLFLVTKILQVVELSQTKIQMKVILHLI